MSNRTVWFLIIFLGATFSLLFFSGGKILSPTKLTAQVGLLVGIAPNPYNTLNAQLQQQQSQLNQQAADLAAREAAFASSTNVSVSASPMIWYLTVAVIIIGLLVCANFYLDWRRSRRAAEEPPRV